MTRKQLNGIKNIYGYGYGLRTPLILAISRGIRYTTVPVIHKVGMQYIGTHPMIEGICSNAESNFSNSHISTDRLMRNQVLFEFLISICDLYGLEWKPG